MVKKILFLFILIISSCGKKDGDVPITTDDIDMSKMRWNPSSFPLQMKVSDNFDNQSQLLLTSALEVWENGASINFFENLQVTPNLNFTKLSDYYDNDKSVNGIYLSTIPLSELGSGYLAVTQIYFRRSTDSSFETYYEIIHADIVVNGSEFSFSTDELDDTTYYLETLILHEAGHVLGIGHQTQGIMLPYMSTDDKNITLGTFDLDLINDKYNPVTNAATSQVSQLNSMANTQDVERVLLYLPVSQYLALKFYKNKIFI